MTESCVPYEWLERYATGTATGPERAGVERHAAVWGEMIWRFFEPMLRPYLQWS